LTYRDASAGLAPISKTVDLSPRLVLQFDNVLENLFGIASGETANGSIFIESVADAQIFGQLFSRTNSSLPWGVSASLPVLPTASDLLSSVASRHPLYLDGLEQSIDATRGTKWIVVLNEIAGRSGEVSLRLYEAGNRSLPIAEKTLAISPFQQIRVDVFPEMGLDSDERHKDRTNVLCVASAQTGGAVITASALAIDNRSGDTRTYVFSPNGGVPATGVSRVVTVTLQPPPPSRRRVVNP